MMRFHLDIGDPHDFILHSCQCSIYDQMSNLNWSDRLKTRWCYQSLRSTLLVAVGFESDTELRKIGFKHL